MSFFEKIAKEHFDKAGITIDGSNDWDIHVKDERFYKRVIQDPDLGFGETYMDGWWESRKVEEMLFRIFQTNNFQLGYPYFRNLFLKKALYFLVNFQNIRRVFKVGESHYDLGNDLFKAITDKRMIYGCGYFKDTDNLDEAQEAKLDLVCRKLDLKAGQKILDIGSGWGGFSKFAAEKYGVQVVGVSISKEQVQYCRELCKGLPIEFRFQDYRSINEPFDHIVSFAMFSHVGDKNYRKFMEVAGRCLKKDGLFLLEEYTSNYTMPPSAYLDKYIFPGYMNPTVAQIAKSVEKIFVIEDMHNNGPDYGKTFMCWQSNFKKNWDTIKMKYDEKFYRMFEYFFFFCAAGCRARIMQNWQILFSKGYNQNCCKIIR